MDEGSVLYPMAGNDISGIKLLGSTSSQSVDWNSFYASRVKCSVVAI